jgi:hypothetical protein
MVLERKQQALARLGALAHPGEFSNTDPRGPPRRAFDNLVRLIGQFVEAGICQAGAGRVLLGG